MLLFAIACGGTSEPPEGASGAAGGSGASGTGGSATGGTGGGTAEVSAPGSRLTSGGSMGWGPCAGFSLAQVLGALHASYPDLADVSEIYDPTATYTGDGSYVHAFATQDGGFALVLKRGLGDCPAGCTDNYYFYFETDATCTPVLVGTYHAGYVPENGNCLTVEGSPMWGIPVAPDPAGVCGADNSPAPISGTYSLRLTGTHVPCSPPSDVTHVDVDTVVTLTIDQDDSNLGTGYVTFGGTGSKIVDDRALPATFTRQRFRVLLAEDNLPAAQCAWNHEVEAQYDFEASAGALRVFEYGTDCVECKGDLMGTLQPIP
jgi:hypothetical protein